MKVPRFRTKSLLIAIAMVAVWLSTFGGYKGSNDLLAHFWTAIVVASGVTAYSYRERWRAFFGTMLLATMKTTFNSYGANLTWTRDAARYLTSTMHGGTSQGQLVVNIQTSLVFLVLIASAVVVGFICVAVYDHSRRNEQ